ncbi:MAG: rhomboid family intramembrane serine protease [Bacteroidales bacterium]|nr:rhomboid family intramembrane serine protease [Bacteroidales bacterium]
MEYYSPQRFKILPPVVKNLLIINGIFFLATISLEKLNIDLVDLLGLHYFASEKFHPYQLITYMFMHGSFMHIFYNMFAVWMFGSAIENVWGTRRFLTFYIITGLGAALTHYVVVYFEMQPTLIAINSFLDNPTNEGLKSFMSSPSFHISSGNIAGLTNEFIAKYNLLMAEGNKTEALQSAVNFISEYKTEFVNAPVVVGASGALFGLLLAFGMMFPNSLIFIYFLLPIKAKYFVIIYGAIELFSGFSKISGDNVAHFAHLGGMLFGYLLIIYWKKRSRYDS